MSPGKPAVAKTEGQRTVEDYIKQTQMQAMGAAHLQVVTYLSSKPPVSSWPMEVRRFIYNQLQVCNQLFAPQSEEEAAAYVQDIPNSGDVH